MLRLRSSLLRMKNLPTAGAASVHVHTQARARLLSELPDAVFTATPPVSSAGYVFSFFQSFVYKPVVASVAAFVFLAGGWMTTSAAVTSLPGDTLYTVKRMTERAQLRISSLDRRAVLHTEFANRRLEEVVALQDTVVASPERAQYIEDTVTAYKQEISSATVDLQTLHEQDQVQALAVAVTVLDQVTALEDMSAEVFANPAEQGVTDDVVQTTESIATVAQDVALDVHEVAPTPTSTRELEMLFRSTLGDLEARRAMIAHRIVRIEEISVTHKDLLAQAGVILPKKSELSAMRASLAAMDATIPSIMSDFAVGGYRSALQTLDMFEVSLRDIEVTLASTEEQITQALAP